MFTYIFTQVVWILKRGQTIVCDCSTQIDAKVYSGNVVVSSRVNVDKTVINKSVTCPKKMGYASSGIALPMHGPFLASSGMNGSWKEGSPAFFITISIPDAILGAEDDPVR